MLKIVILVVVSLAALVNAENKAIAVITTSSAGVTGSITFTETKDGVHIEGTIKGLQPGKHGFHVHAKGDLTDGCASTGSHFNPYNKTHGGPDAENRHVGDLGNIEAGGNGIATINIMDKVISLTGETGILGRAILIHAKEDDLGLKETEESHTTGSAGDRIGCGIIGIFSDDFKFNGGAGFSPNILIITISLLIYLKYWK